MKLPSFRYSFRFQIALLSAALTGGALVGFGVISWKLIYDAKVSRLDANLTNQLLRAARPREQDRWLSYKASLPQRLGTGVDTPTALLVIGSQGKTLYQSDRWTTDFNAEALFPPRPPLLRDQLPSPPPESRRRPERAPDRPERGPGGPPAEPQFATRYTTTGAWRVGAVSFVHAQVAVAISLQAIDQEMAVIRNIFLISIPVVLLLGAGGAWSLSGSALRPIRELASAIRQVTVKGLDQRVPISATDVEFVELIRVFNQMLERLERSFKQASRFSADAAHELKTPLTILQGELERTLQQADSGSEVQQSLGNLLDEVQRLGGIVRKLLLLSLADAGQMSLHKVEVNLSEMLIEMTEDIELLAPHLEVQTEIASEVRVLGDRDLLTQILQNLFSNAIKYNLAEGWIRIQAQQQATTALVTISNSSKDIPASERDRIFDRFHRGDPARTRKIEGTGLGLSLAREIARAHGGELTLDPTPSGQTAFTLKLPSGAQTGSRPSLVEV
ncbi:ATP-binding protein [Leptolyngbya sp. FACHB-261]|uniref:ATP-binding protein n=1 Tax=Leptolyngbya sp. FACHB-261 TaxID=2692806 RepID=UPI00168419EA|nr:ATP-binding protein [Leptolyngbya sp. FACHB-261]MBD2101649.1 HAMP domain-containing protein [Leptolyngbya sp. FACHB-261]